MARGNDFPEVLIAPTRSKTIANIFGSAMFAIAAVFFLLTPDIYARLVGIVGLWHAMHILASRNVQT